MATQKLGASHDVTSKSKPIGQDGVKRSLSKTNSHPKVGESTNSPSDNAELGEKGTEVAKTSVVAIERLVVDILFFSPDLIDSNS